MNVEVSDKIAIIATRKPPKQQTNDIHFQGILSVVGEKNPVMMQAVQELYETEPVGSWPDGSTRSCKLVLIGWFLLSR